MRYRQFKQSLFNDILFVPEKRKENRGAISSTKRIYSVYGNKGTGIEYKYVALVLLITLTHFSNLHRASVDCSPACISILFHSLQSIGVKMDDQSCVMIACYPPSNKQDIELAQKEDRADFTAMSFHADGTSPLQLLRTL